MTCPVTIRVQPDDFDIAAETSALTKGRSDVGAVASFTGLCRGDDGLLALTLEHFPGMAEAQIAEHVSEAQKRWALLGVTVIHRVGRMLPGDNIVLVLTASSHRAMALEAAQFLMDYLKSDAPFWKKEERASETRWVEAHAKDDAAMARWKKT